MSVRRINAGFGNQAENFSFKGEVKRKERSTTKIGKGEFSLALGAICILLSLFLAAPSHAENILDKIEKTGKVAMAFR